MPKSSTENQYYELLHNLRSEIYSHPYFDWSISYISKSMNLSRSYIQHLYQSAFNNSITADIKNSRMEYAKYLLSSTNMTVTSISEQCGYKNDVHFMRLFKQVTGVTPSQFRKK